MVTENKKDDKPSKNNRFVELLNKAGKSWKDFWDTPVTIQYAYSPHAVVGNGGTPFSSTQRRGDFATQVAGALAIPTTAAGVAAIGLPATAVGMGVGIGAGAAGSAGGSKLIELVGGDENAQEMVGDIAGFTLGAIAGGKATKATTNYLNFWNSLLSPRSIYTAMAEGMTPTTTQKYGLVKYYGPTMGKTTAARTNPKLVDFDDIVRGPIAELAAKKGVTPRDLKIANDPDYISLLEAEVARWRMNPANAGKTLVISNKALSSSTTGYNNHPSIPDKETFIARQVLRGGNREEAAAYYDALIENNPNLKIDNRFVSDIESGTRAAQISEAERLGIPKGVRNNKNIVREVPDSQLDDKIWVLKDGTYLEGTFRDIKPGQLFKYDPQDAISYTYTNGPDKNPLNPDRYLLSDGEFLGLDYMSEYGGNSFLRKDSPIYNHIKMLSNSLLHDKLKAIAADIQMPRELYALFLNPRYIQSFKQYYLNKGWRVGNLADEEIAKIIAYNHKLLTSNLTGVAKDVILWNGSGKQMTADGAVVREAAPDNFKIITENLQGGGGDIRGVWFSDFNDALSYGYPKQIGGSRQHTWEGVLLVDILPYLINDARGHMSACYKFDGHTAPKNLILHSRELVSGDLDNIKGLFPHPELILLEGNGFTRSWSTKGLHYKNGGKLNYLNLMNNVR